MSMVKLDMNSLEFKKELEKTVRFTDKVIAQFGWEYNPQADINEAIQLGLARNKILYNKRFCPCFMVDEVDGKPQSSDNRVCPCTPAIEHEIPEDGVCHCQIFCSPEFAANRRKELNMEEIIYTRKRELSQEECLMLLQRKELDSNDLIALLDARKDKLTDFYLIDVREKNEDNNKHIKGTDKFIPTSTIFNNIADESIHKDDYLILYSHDTQRAQYCAQMLNDLGYKNISILQHGITAFTGEIQ